MPEEEKRESPPPEAEAVESGEPEKAEQEEIPELEVPEGAETESGTEPETEPEESPEELIRALESEAREEDSEGKGSRWAGLLALAGILLSLAGIGAGAYVLRGLLSQGGAAAPAVEARAPKPSAGLARETPSVKGAASREPLGSMPLRVRPEHTLVLKHFLVPLQSEGGAPVFIKASVVLYFGSRREVLRARKLENPLRGVIYETFKNIPFYYWRSPEGITRIKQALLKALSERAPGNLKVSDVEVTGYILK